MDATSILTTTKKLCGGIDENDTSFDDDMIVFINGVLFTLNQVGIGPAEGFAIKDKNDKWTDLIGDRTDLEGVKSYVYLKTRLIFDPPQSSFLLKAMQDQITEFEWRLNVQVEGGS
jgi:hypothetical protein